jgi:outer membrane protein assembly factor BamD
MMNLVKSCSFGCLLALALTASACGSRDPNPPVGTPEPDKFLFDRGMEELGKRRWLTAREYYRQLIDGYPQSAFRAEAKLGIGDTYLGEGTLEAQVLALNEYREFLTFFPTHQRADYAQYKLGMAHFDQMLAPDRDQTETREAIREFEAFLERYPQSELLPEVQKRLREAKDRLSEHDYRVGLHYYRIKWYPGAIGRFKPLLDRDPEYTNRDAVYFYFGESLLKSNLPAAALPYYERLVKEFERSEYLEEAKRRIEELKKTYAESRH